MTGEASLTLDRSVVSGNRALYEGGGISNRGSLVLKDSSVVGNQAGHRSYGQGGGILNYGTLTLNGSSSVRGNQAANTGGGIKNFGRVIMNDSSSVRGNTSSLGGGIVLEGSRRLPAPTLTMSDASSVHGNTAESPSPTSNGIGGGILDNSFGRHHHVEELVLGEWEPRRERRWRDLCATAAAPSS